MARRASFVVTESLSTIAALGCHKWQAIAQPERALDRTREETTESIGSTNKRRPALETGSKSLNRPLLYFLCEIYFNVNGTFLSLTNCAWVLKRLQSVSLAITIYLNCGHPWRLRFPIRAAFPYIAQTVIPLVRQTLHKDLAALCLTDN